MIWVMMGHRLLLPPETLPSVLTVPLAPALMWPVILWPPAHLVYGVLSTVSQIGITG